MSIGSILKSTKLCHYDFRMEKYQVNSLNTAAYAEMKFTMQLHDWFDLQSVFNLNLKAYFE